LAASLDGPIARKRCHAISVFFLRQIGSAESWPPVVGQGLRARMPDELPFELAGPGAVDDLLRARRLWAQLNKAKKAAGLTRGTLHGFRHSLVSMMANANLSPFTVVKILGRRSLDVILTYCHVSEDELLGAVHSVSFEAVLEGKRNEKQSASGQPPPRGGGRLVFNVLCDKEMV
jgi:hypothetical protein